jgi:hypothetical protein
VVSGLGLISPLAKTVPHVFIKTIPSQITTTILSNDSTMAAQSDCTAKLASPENCASPKSLRDQLLLEVEAHKTLFKSTPCFGRRVSFEHDRSTNEIYKEYYESNLCLTYEEVGRMWWSRDELQIINREVRVMSSYYRKHRCDYITDFEHLFSKCAESCSGRRLREFGLVHKPNQRPFRGLERLIHGTLSRHSSRYVISILKIQSKIPAEIDPELYVKLLCAKSLQLSKPSRNLARFAAYQDYFEVAGIISEELLGSSFATLSHVR